MQKPKFWIQGKATLNMSKAKLQGIVHNVVFTVDVQNTSDPVLYPIGCKVQFILKKRLKMDCQILASLYGSGRITMLSDLDGLSVDIKFTEIQVHRTHWEKPVPRVIKIS